MTNTQFKVSSILWRDGSVFNLGKRMNEKEFRNLLAFSFKKKNHPDYRDIK